MNIIDRVLSRPEFVERPPVLVDIGAAGAIHPQWASIAKYSICIAFDADARQMGYVAKETDKYRKLHVYPSLVSDRDETETDFHLARSPSCSSLLRPDLAAANRWSFGQLFEIERSVKMQTVGLARVLKEVGIGTVDWFKSDSQGIDLRLFRSLSDEQLKRVLVAEFEPGFIDIYQGEDKLWTILAFMEKQPFWLADMCVHGPQRISTSTLRGVFPHAEDGLMAKINLKSSPGWAEITYVNDMQAAAPFFSQRDFMLGWVFAVIEEQYGFAFETAAEGYKRFSDPVFLEMQNCAYGILSGLCPAETALKTAWPAKLTAADCTLLLRGRAISLLEANDVQGALDVVIRAKALRHPTQGLDLLRAMCFLAMKQERSAAQALQEELRLFPQNSEAKALLERIFSSVDEAPAASTTDPEFDELYKSIKPYTMLGPDRLQSLYELSRLVGGKGIQGNFVECGVAAGGSTALLAYAIKRFSGTSRKLYACDSFEGMPDPGVHDKLGCLQAQATGWGTGTCAATEAGVKEVCQKLGVDQTVVTVKGFFEHTLPQKVKEIGPIAFLHIDADWYQSIRTILETLYDSVVVGGIIQLDDYGYWEGCSKALHEFEAQRHLKFDLHKVGRWAVWFSKP